MGDPLGSFSKNMLVRKKHAEQTRVSLWGHPIILKIVWGITNGIRANLSQYDVVRRQTKLKLVGM